MSDVKEIHEEKLTLSVDVNIPGHDPRVTTPLFIHSKAALIAREGGRCFVSGQTADESGHPLEAHHHPIERSFANMIDWVRFAKDCQAGIWGPHPMAFDWVGFFIGGETVTVDLPAAKVSYVKPLDPYLFVDDMRVNGMLLSKPFHTMVDMGIHNLPYPVWIAQRYGIEGYKFSNVEIIHHEVTP
jgi:hypothetical protein